MNTINEDESKTKEEKKEKENEHQTIISRLSHRIQTEKKENKNFNLILHRKSSKINHRFSVTITHRINPLSKISSSKAINLIKKHSKGLVTDIMIQELIDPSYNFLMNYQLKETALKIFKLGLEGDKTKIKFFCNYLYQLAPFNKIFSKLSTSNDYSDKARLEIILYNLAINLKSEFIEKNKIIYLHGDTPDKYYIILKGEVDIIIPNEMEVMMTEYEYFYYILRLYKCQEHSLLAKVLNKNYDLYPLDKKLLEDWIQTGYNTLVNLEKENELNKRKKKYKNNKNYQMAYTNTKELITHLEKQKKLNLLMLSTNVILLLEKIRIRNEKARDAKKNKALTKKEKKNKKNKHKANTEENLKPSIGYVKLNGQMKKIFMNDEQIEVVEKCASEISQLIEMKSEDFNFQKYVHQLNRCEPEKYINRVKPHFFDEDINDVLDPEPFILSKNEQNEKLPKVNIEEDEDDIFYKLRNLFGYKKSVDNRQKELFNNRKKTVVYNYVLVNSNSTGDTFGDIIYEISKFEEVNPRIATVISKENCHLATLKRSLYNKILREFNENNLHHQFLFLYSLDIFKDCNKNTFMKNMSFFIKRTVRSNEILFNQDDNFGEDRSIYFVESGSFTSYCNISINEIEILFNNLNYVGLIPPDDAYEDNLFNKENHNFCQFKKKKIFLNLFTFSKRDIIGFNDALYNQRYIYTVKCQSAFAVVYEIKLKFFNLIVNSEPKLYQILERYETVKRNIMVKFFLNAFNNKTNIYKFISYDDLDKEKGEKKAVHKNYFGKNPFIDEKKINDQNNNKTNFKTVKTVNKVNDNIVELMPELKKADIITSDNNKTQLITRKTNDLKLSLLSSNKSLHRFLSPSRNTKHVLQLSTDKINRRLKKKLSGIYFNKELLKMKTENNNNNNNAQINLFPIISNALPKVNSNNNLSKRNEILSTLFQEHKYNDNDSQHINTYRSKTISKFNSKEINKNNEYFIGSSILSEKLLKDRSFKSKGKYLRGFKKYLNTDGNNNIKLKNKEGINQDEEIRLKCYLKGIPDFYEKNKSSKKVFFAMNKKSLYKNNVLFTDFQ